MIKDIGSAYNIFTHFSKWDNAIENHQVWDIPQIKRNGFELLEIGVRRSGCGYEEVMRMDQDVELVIRCRLTRDIN